jgi:ribosomal protein S18 acetylase RimI-like enzyme
MPGGRPLEIREADDFDREQIAALWTEAYCGPGTGQRRQPYAVRDVEDAQIDGRIFIAGGRKIAGVVVCYPPGSSDRETPHPREAELSRLAVAASSRRQGNGRALAQRCLQAAKERNAEALVLWSRPHQEEAHRLYVSLGFARAPGRDRNDSAGERWVYIHPFRHK